jgi:hypothetical protein
MKEDNKMVEIRFKISKQGMKRGYWKLVDILTGETIESGYKSKAAIFMNAVERNARIGVDTNYYKRDEYEI